MKSFTVSVPRKASVFLDNCGVQKYERKEGSAQHGKKFFRDQLSNFEKIFQRRVVPTPSTFEH